MFETTVYGRLVLHKEAHSGASGSWNAADVMNFTLIVSVRFDSKVLKSVWLFHRQEKPRHFSAAGPGRDSQISTAIALANEGKHDSIMKNCSSPMLRLSIKLFKYANGSQESPHPSRS